MLILDTNLLRPVSRFRPDGSPAPSHRIPGKRKAPPNTDHIETLAAWWRSIYSVLASPGAYIPREEDTRL